METGLRHRLKRVMRQTSDQHRHLKAIFAELVEALGRGAPRDDALACFAHYREAIDAHFALESDVFFPAVHGLHPARAAELAALEREHAALADILGEVRVRIERGRRGDAKRALERFAEELRAHEKREERLVAQLDV